jgi:TPR repeat protein
MRYKHIAVATKIVITVCCLHVSGCASVAIEATSIAADKAAINRNIDDAKAGDPTAQYAVGDALCCSGDAPEGSLYNTSEALLWLCRAADQGHADAMQKLGQIFEGDQVDGVRLIRRAVTAVSTVPQNRAAAHYWYARAGEASKSDAAKAADELYPSLTAAEKALLAAYQERSTPPCDWTDLRAASGPIP